MNRQWKSAASKKSTAPWERRCRVRLRERHSCGRRRQFYWERREPLNALQTAERNVPWRSTQTRERRKFAERNRRRECQRTEMPGRPPVREAQICKISSPVSVAESAGQFSGWRATEADGPG